MSDLPTLWANRLKVIVSNLEHGEREHRDLAATAQHVGADYHGRFLIELIQNAADQASRAGLTDSEVVVVRTPDAVAVVNQGRPLDEEGLKALTSLGHDTKDPALAIGNKGLGFKSVFQVCAEPEVYSAPLEGGGITTDGGYRVAFASEPFENQTLRQALTHVARDFERDHPGTVDRIRDQHPGRSFEETLLFEAKHAAPFRFPLAKERSELDSRLLALKCGDELAKRTGALVFLPLKGSPGVEQWVNDAFDEVTGDPDATAVLFLTGVGSVRCEDHSRGITWVLERGRAKEASVKRRNHITSYSAIWTTRRRVEGGDSTAETSPRTWLVLSRTLGAVKDSEGTIAADERKRIASAVAELPGEHWAQVDHAAVEVALPLPPEGSSIVGPLGADGRFCIGLPTIMKTGTPLLVNARFHGNISRKEIDLRQNPYNGLLFSEASELAKDLVEVLKASEDVDRRRLATLAAETSTGPLADKFREPGGLAHSAIVLAEDGRSFNQGRAIAMPRQEDMPIFRLIAADTADRADLALPDAQLMNCCREVLRQLHVGEGPEGGADTRFLDRDAAGGSFVERGAHRHRDTGQTFWGPFLNWLLDRYDGKALAEQRFLPVGTNDLASPVDMVYAKPVFPKAVLQADVEDDPQRLDRVIADTLEIFDDRCVAIREGEGVKYTSLGNRLRQTAPPCVREPELADLMREVFSPRLLKLTAARGGEREVLRLLRLLAKWAEARKATDLPYDLLRVPVVGDSMDQVAWAEPTRAYFGEGWQDHETDALLSRAYGGDPQRMLVSWDDFVRLTGTNDEPREEWLKALSTLGVQSKPGIDAYEHTNPPLQSHSYKGPLGIASGAQCPVEGAEREWNLYIETIRQRPSTVSSGQQYDVEEILWIDGLEVESARTHVVELVLRRPHAFESHLSTQLWRTPGKGDATEVASMWVHALARSTWPVIPTNSGLVPANSAWLLLNEQRRERQRRYRFVPCVVEFAEPAERVLQAIGVATIVGAPADRYVRALQDLAAQLAGLDPEDHDDARVLAETLYRELQTRLASEPIALPTIVDRPLPMFDGISRRRLRAVDLTTGGIILVDDNRARARFVEGAREAAVLPLSPKLGHAALVAAIEDRLGEGSVRYTSTAPVRVAFEGLNLPETTVTAFLEKSFPAHSLRRDIGLLLSAAATPSTDIKPETMMARLRVFDRVLLRFGTFADDVDTPSFFDEHGSEGPVLLVDQALRSVPDRVFAATWELVGAHRDLWDSYSRALRDGETERFLTAREVTSEDVHDVEVLLDPDRETRFGQLRTAAFAIGLAGGVFKDAGVFAAEWVHHAHATQSLARWVGREDLADAMAFAASMDDEERGSLSLLSAASLTTGDWQRARELLGIPRHSFAVSRRAFHQAREIAATALMATAAHALSANLDAARAIIEYIRALAPDAALLETPNDTVTMLPHVLKTAHQHLIAQPSDGLTVLESRLDEAIRAPVPEQSNVLRARVPKREVEEYGVSADARTAAAKRDVGIVLEVATALASVLGEAIDLQRIREDGRVAALESGWWANRFAVLDPLRQALADVAPLTATRLSEERAFRDPGPPGALMGQLDELKAKVTGTDSVARSPMVRLINVGAVSLTRADLDQDLAKGSNGQLGMELRRHLPEGLDLGQLRRTENVPSRPASRGPGGGRGRGKRGYLESNDDREINGLLGEAFVYEAFREQLPGFDYQCWRSENAIRYGVATTGDDSLGADFVYRDVSGELTARSDSPEVFLEVKATSGEGSAPFSITAGEWEVALRCNLESGQRAYVIVRVEFVCSAPKLHRVYVDPVNLSRNGKLRVDWKDLLAYGG